MEIFAHRMYSGPQCYWFKLQLYDDRYVWGFVSSCNYVPKGYLIPPDRRLQRKSYKGRTLYWFDLEQNDFKGDYH